MTLPFLFACGSRDTEAPPTAATGSGPAYGDIIVEGSIGDASNLIPILSSDATSHQIGGLVYNGLVKYDRDLKIVGDLAESWKISPDGLDIVFHLRKGVKWHDGEPFTARDVLFTYQVTIDPKTPTAYAGDFLKVKKVTVLDDHTLRVCYDKPFAPALMSWGSPILPSHLLFGRDITTSPLSRRPVGTGPYRFREWVAGQKIVLAANPDYFEGRPYLDGYVMRIIPDTATMFLELRAGGIDQMGLTPLQHTRQTENNLFRKNYRKYRYLSFSYVYMGYNLKNPLFADKRIRQAIAYAVNKEEMIRGVLLGLGQAATGPYKPGTWAYNNRVRTYPYDPGRAKSLLAEAGWRDSDGDGILDKDGQAFKITLYTWPQRPALPLIEQAVQSQLKEIGIEAEARVMESDAISERAGEWGMIWVGGGDACMMIPDPSYYIENEFLSTEVDYHYANPEVDDLILEARSTFDSEKRNDLYKQVQKIVYDEDCAQIPIAYHYLCVVTKNDVKGYVPNPAHHDYCINTGIYRE